MKVEYYTPSNFSELKESWKILECGNEMTVFQKYEWYENINRLYFKERVKNLFREWMYVLVKSDSNTPLMILPIQIVKFGCQCKSIGLRKGFYFIGRIGYTDYLNCIYSDFKYEAFRLACKSLQDKFGLSYFCLERILAGTSMAEYIKEAFTCNVSECKCAALILPDTFDEYSKSLSKSSRQNIRTAINRQKRNNIQLSYKMVYSVDEITANKLYEIRNMRLKKKKKDSRSRASIIGKMYMIAHDFLSKLVDAKHDVINESCNQWCFLVEDNKKIASFFWGMYDKSIYYVCIAGVNEEYAWYSPSISCLYQYIQDLYEEKKTDISVIDFTRGGERYKEDIGGTKKSSLNFRFSVKGQVL